MNPWAIVDKHSYLRQAATDTTTIIQSGEEPPPRSGQLNHALSQVGGPTQSQLSRPMSSRHRISMEHRLWRKHLLLNPKITKARSKEEKRNTFLKKNSKKGKIGENEKKE